MAHGNSHWKRLGEGTILAEDMDQGLGHIVPVKTYTKVFLALIVGTILTVLAASVDLGAWNLAVAILIATVKVSLVGMFFMHLKFESKGIWFVATYPIILLVLLFMGTFGDAVIASEDDQIKPAVEATLVHGDGK